MELRVDNVNIDELIFKPSIEGLRQARQRRLLREQQLSTTQFTKEQKEERKKIELEVFKDMQVYRERAILCQDEE